MDNIPSANMRQHKLDQQRRLIEEKQRQKRYIELSLFHVFAKKHPMTNHVKALVLVPTNMLMIGND